jgi:hypothetical protein
MPPLKHSTNRREIRWSEWIESMRKDVECTFGILKGRFRILKSGIRLQGTINADKIWCTCCALHNWLLEVDGLDVRWERGVPSHWQGEDGQHRDDEDGMASMASQDGIASHFALRRLHRPAESRDMSSMGRGADYEPDIVAANPQLELQPPTENHDKVRLVRKLPFEYFRTRLIEHFDILWTQHKVVWPVRN